MLTQTQAQAQGRSHVQHANAIEYSMMVDETDVMALFFSLPLGLRQIQTQTFMGLRNLLKKTTSERLP